MLDLKPCGKHFVFQYVFALKVGATATIVEEVSTAASIETQNATVPWRKNALASSS
jgi:hypothetical protein